MKSTNVRYHQQRPVEKKLPPSTEPILTACPVLQDASSPAQFQRALSGDKDQGEPTVLKWPLESVLVRQKSFQRNL